MIFRICIVFQPDVHKGNSFFFSVFVNKLIRRINYIAYIKKDVKGGDMKPLITMFELHYH